jgi:exodeoxyribonuclease VII small subunit
MEPKQVDTLGETLQFSEALKRLEEIVALLEKDTTELDVALKAYEEGTQIARNCLDRLKEAELRVEELKLG